MIKRHFPDGEFMSESDPVTEKCTTVVIGMTAFVGQREEGVGAEIEHQVLQCSMRASQIQIEFLIDDGEECVAVEADGLSGERRFVPANMDVLLAAAKTLPEKFVPWTAVGAENNRGLFDPLHDYAGADAFVVRMGHHDKCAFPEFSDSIARQRGLGYAAIAAVDSMSNAI